MALSPAQRIQLGLDDPPPLPAHGQEFLPKAPDFIGGPGNPNTLAPNPRLALVVSNLADGDRITAPRIRGMVNELLAGNVANADQALKQLFVANPKVALEMYLELAEFTLPKLKAVAVQVDDTSGGNPRALTFAQLQAALHGGT